MLLSCIGCKHLGNCKTVDEEKLMTGYYCGDWREEPPASVAARQQIMTKFGAAGAAILIKPSEKGE